MKNFSKCMGQSLFGAAVISLAAMTVPAVAQADYPEKSIQVIVPAGAGGDTDANARLFGKYLEEELGESVVIVNVKGGGGTIGMKRVLNAKSDGHTVLFFHGEAMIPKLAGLVDYGIEDFQMVGIGVIDDTTVLATHPGMPYSNLEEMVDYAKAHPGEVEFGMQIGGYPHLIGVALEDIAGIDLNLVDVGGNAAKTVALKGQNIDVINTQYGLTKDYFKAGDFVNLGLMSEQRNPLMDEVPTLAEQGFPAEFNKFFFYAMPKDVSEEVVDTFSAAMKRVVNNPDYQAEASRLFVTPTYMDPEEGAKYAAKQYEYFSQFQDLFRAGS